VRDPQLSADVTRPDPELRQFDDSDPDRVGKRPAVDEHTAELVHLPVRLICNRFIIFNYTVQFLGYDDDNNNRPSL